MITFNDKKEIRELFFWTNKWGKFISLSGHSDENRNKRKINGRNILPAGKLLIYGVHVCVSMERKCDRVTEGASMSCERERVIRNSLQKFHFKDRTLTGDIRLKTFKFF